jgi:hypothetical protein
MDKRINWLIMALLILSLIGNIILIIIMRARGDATGFVAKEAEKPFFQSDVIEIDKAELNQCCNFINSKGEEDGCYVLKDYGCDYCSNYCS